MKRKKYKQIQSFVFIYVSLITEKVCLNLIEGLYRALFTLLKNSPLAGAFTPSSRG